MKLQRYSEYKEINETWIKELPRHWNMTRTKNIFRLRTEKSGKDHGRELLSVYTHIGVRPRKTLEQKGNRATTTDDYWRVYIGDIVVNKLLAWMGAIGISNYDGVTSPAYDILRHIQDCNPEYYHYLFRTKTYLHQFKSRSRGIMAMRLRLYFDQFGQILLINPPKLEQDKIVLYIKSIEKKINKFIKNKRRLISLLKEHRQAVITQAVVRGINTNVRMKQSNFDCLGKIPEHWKIYRLKYVLTKIESGLREDCDQNTSIYSIGGEHITWSGRLKLNNPRYLHESYFQKINSGKIILGDNLLVKDGATIGKNMIWDEGCPKEAAVNEHVFILRVNKNYILKEFLYYLLCSYIGQEQLKLSIQGAAQPGLNSFFASKFLCPVTSLPEQQQIIKYLAREVLKFDNAIDKIEHEIELIQEFLARLIFNVVTGKVDVRNIKVEGVSDKESVDDISSAEDSEELEDNVAEVQDANE